MKGRGIRVWTGWVAIGLAVLMWLALPVLPFLPFSVATRASLAGALLIVAEVIFWVGLVLMGPEVAAKVKAWRRKLLPGKRAALAPEQKDASADPEHPESVKG